MSHRCGADLRNERKSSTRRRLNYKSWKTVSYEQKKKLNRNGKICHLLKATPTPIKNGSWCVSRERICLLVSCWFSNSIKLHAEGIFAIQSLRSACIVSDSFPSALHLIDGGPAFCKECIDARISTRQRKCPACGVAFSQTDVLNGMFFQ